MNPCVSTVLTFMYVERLESKIVSLILHIFDFFYSTLNTLRGNRLCSRFINLLYCTLEANDALFIHHICLTILDTPSGKVIICIS